MFSLERARARNTHVEATSNHPFAAQAHVANGGSLKPGGKVGKQEGRTDATSKMFRVLRVLRLVKIARFLKLVRLLNKVRSKDKWEDEETLARHSTILERLAEKLDLDDHRPHAFDTDEPDLLERLDEGEDEQKDARPRRPQFEGAGDVPARSLGGVGPPMESLK